jgi:hypothetical protein
MLTSIKYLNVKGIIENITRLDRDRKNILKALESPVLSCTISYGSGGSVSLYDVDFMLKILNGQLKLIEEELIKYCNELEKYERISNDNIRSSNTSDSL